MNLNAKSKCYPSILSYLRISMKTKGFLIHPQKSNKGKFVHSFSYIRVNIFDFIFSAEGTKVYNISVKVITQWGFSWYIHVNIALNMVIYKRILLKVKFWKMETVHQSNAFKLFNAVYEYIYEECSSVTIFRIYIPTS